MHITAQILTEFWIRGEHMHNGLYARKNVTPVDAATHWYLHASFNDLMEVVLSNPIDWSKPLEDVTKQIIAIKAASY